MNDLLPLLVFPLAYGWYLSARRGEQELHDTLASSTAQPAGIPLMDAGPAPVLRVAASLAIRTPPRRDAALGVARLAPRGGRARHDAFDAFLEPLGLQLRRVPARPKSTVAHRGPSDATMLGDRHGRHVQVVLGSGWQAVRLGARGLVQYRVHGVDGQLVVAPGGPDSVRVGLGTLQAHARWSELTIVGGEGWLSLERRAQRPQSWIHDLWLAEFVADLVLLADGAPGKARAGEAQPAYAGGPPGQGQTALQ